MSDPACPQDVLDQCRKAMIEDKNRPPWLRPCDHKELKYQTAERIGPVWIVECKACHAALWWPRQ